MKMELLEGCLEAIIRSVSGEKNQEMLRYSVFPGGKRIRPRVLFATLRALGVTPSDLTIKMAAIIELIHTASLVHDDLPSLDNDDIRRGKPAAHITYGEGEGVLLGDLILSVAFKESGELLGLNGIVKGKESEVVKALGESSEIVCSGQLIDIQKANNINDLRELHEQKTGALFSVASYLPTLVTEGLSDQERLLFKGFGKKFGVAFQCVNDLKDGDGLSDNISDDIAPYISKTEKTITLAFKELEEISLKRGGEITPLREIVSEVMAQLSKLATSTESRDLVHQ